jgi:Fe-S-cluster containining protein
MCCDGTLFNHANIKENEPSVTGYSFEIIENVKRTFKLPCAYLKETVCSIYKERPYDICESFQCKLLISLRTEKKSFVDAMKIINETITLKTKIESQLLEYHPENTGDRLPSKMKEFNAHFAGTMSDVEFRRKYGKILLDFFMLNKILNDSFRKNQRLSDSHSWRYDIS